MITVAISAYKPEALAEAVASVLAQTWPDFELLIVDDASPADLDGVLDAFSDPRIRRHRNPRNLGGASLAGAWNRCLELAQGELFVMFSDDDRLDPRYLGEMARLAEAHPETALFHSRVRVIDEAGRPRDWSAACAPWESAIEFAWQRICARRRQFAPEFCCRTEALRAAGGFVDFPLAWGSDDATWFLLARQGGVAASPLALCDWRQSTRNISARGDLRQRLLALAAYEGWVREWSAGLQPATADEGHQLAQLRRALPGRVEQLRRNLLAQGLPPTPAGCWRCLARWLRHRGEFRLGIRLLLAAFAQLAARVRRP